MASTQSPLSPHLQVYRPQLTSVLSITHRGTGVFLSLGALLLCYWLIAIASGAEVYTAVMDHVAAWYGITIVVGSLFSLYYHLLNGIRHLFWDAGMGLELEATYRSGWTVVVLSLLLTAVTVWLRIAT